MSPNDPTLYILTFDTKGHVTGRRSTGTFELDFDRCTPANIVHDIATGQYEGIDRIYECIPDEGTCRDVTEDFAREVRAVALDRAMGEEVSWELRNWLDGVLGCERVARAEKAA